jgi:AraC-like DNA-binding protein
MVAQVWGADIDGCDETGAWHETGACPEVATVLSQDRPGVGETALARPAPPGAKRRHRRAVTSESSSEREVAMSRSDLVGIRCWQEGSESTERPAGHEGIEVDLLEGSQLEYYLHRGNVVRIRPVRAAIFWAAFPHQLSQRATIGVLHRLVIPLDLFLSRGLPERLVVGVLAGRLLSADVLTRLVIVNKFVQWEQDVGSGSLEMRRAALLEIDGWLRRLTPDLSDDVATPEFASAGPQGRSVEVVAAMCQYIVRHFRDAVYVADVARSANVHPQHAMAIFRETIGCTIVDYLTRCRVGEAQRLLVSTEATTSEVAFASGFGSISQFYERFTSTCHQTPRQYRLEMRPR